MACTGTNRAECVTLRVASATRSRFVLLPIAIAALTTGAATAGAEVIPANDRDPMAHLAEPGDRVVLSDETTVSRWVHADRVVPIRRSPAPRAGTLTRTRLQNEDLLPEVYLVLNGRVDDAGRVWLQIRVPMRPNGQIGWVEAKAMSEMTVVRTRLVVDRSRLQATLYRSGRVIWRSRVGVGKASTPTPAGNFYVRGVLRGGGAGTVYGPWAIGTSAYAAVSEWPRGGVVGIHGTNEPHRIPGRPSAGCVRVPNAAITRLKNLMPIGTPVQIR